MKTSIPFSIKIIAGTLLIPACNISPEKPNILIINIDDMGWRDVGFMA